MTSEVHSILLNSPATLNFLAKTTTHFLVFPLLWLLLSVLHWPESFSSRFSRSLGLFRLSLLFPLYRPSPWSPPCSSFSYCLHVSDCHCLALLSFSPTTPMAISIWLFQKLLKLTMSKNRLIFLPKCVFSSRFTILLGNGTIYLPLLLRRTV